MVEPVRFFSNPSNAADNFFQSASNAFSEREVQERALIEFNQLRDTLIKHGIEVKIFQDIAKNQTPDSIFPNNWFSTHESRLVLYPMKAENRRKERRVEIVEDLKKSYPEVLDLTSFETKDQYLEGTGSLVLDRVRKIAYASLSTRTSEKLVSYWGEKLGYKTVVFTAQDERRRAIYHTNVMMSIGTGYAIMCLESIPDPVQRKEAKMSLLQSGIEVIPIAYDQLGSLCGNVLELMTKEGKKLLVMSTRAHLAYRKKQLDALSRHAEIVIADISTIEVYGGGGVRCMLAELF